MVELVVKPCGPSLSTRMPFCIDYYRFSLAQIPPAHRLQNVRFEEATLPEVLVLMVRSHAVLWVLLLS